MRSSGELVQSTNKSKNPGLHNHLNFNRGYYSLFISYITSFLDFEIHSGPLGTVSYFLTLSSPSFLSV